MPDESVVALFNGRGFACSGVVVGTREVLTAKHCLPIVAVGVGPNAFSARRIKAAGSIVFDSGLDLALVHVEQRLETPALAVSPEVGPFPKSVTIAGFGALDARGERGYGVRHAQTVTLRGEGCRLANTLRVGCTPGVDLVMARGQSRDSCVGDSGGPMLEWSAAGWSVIAITSRSIEHALLPCGDGGVYVRTDIIQRRLARELSKGEGKR